MRRRSLNRNILPIVLFGWAAVPVAAQRRCADKPAIQDWGGAYFRKVVSHPEVASLGIATEGVLPRFIADPKRYFTPKDPKLEIQIGPLDRGSLYLGGNGNGKELDSGLTWNRVYDSRKRPAFTDLPEGTDGGDPRHRFFKVHAGAAASIEDGTGAVVASDAKTVNALSARLVPDFAFRPFWRTTNNNGNQWNVPEPGSPKNVYFYPGESFTMLLELISDLTFQMTIAVKGAAQDRVFTVIFKQDGFHANLPGQLHTFKRVNSIDQYVLDRGVRRGNENRDVIPTKAKALGLRWEKVFVLGLGESRAPLAAANCAEVHGRDTEPAYDRVFHLSGFTAEGGESVDITPEGMALPIERSKASLPL